MSRSRLQNFLIAKLEDAIEKNSQFGKYVLFLGAIELTAVPDVSGEAALLEEAELTNLLSNFEAGEPPKALTHALATNQNGFGLVELARSTATGSARR